VPRPEKHQVNSWRLHRLRNLLAKLPDDRALQDRVRRAYWAALDEAVDDADAERRLRALVGELGGSFPSAAACLADDLAALCVHLRLAPRVRKRLRSSNLLERSLEEVRRRTKVIGRFPGETSCLSLCWAVLDLVVGDARGLGRTDIERHELAAVRAQRAALPASDRMIA
jgi:putative transposase